MTFIGTALLWFGWFGFNAGSSLGSGALAVSAFVNTNSAAAMAALAWMTASWLRHKRPSIMGASAGAVAGLVAITPAAGFVTPMAALLIGFIAGTGCFFVVEYVVRGRIDDALDVFGVHGIGGILGALLVGIFATKSINPAGADGLLISGDFKQLGVQALTVGVVALYSGGMTWGILKIIDLVFGLRVSQRDEQLGLDSTQHGEVAYRIGS